MLTRRSFDLTEAGVLIVDADHSPDFETQGSYSITIVAIPRAGMPSYVVAGGIDRRRSAVRTARSYGRLDVTVKVVNYEDPGRWSCPRVSLRLTRPVLAHALMVDKRRPDAECDVAVAQGSLLS